MFLIPCSPNFSIISPASKVLGMVYLNFLAGIFCSNNLSNSANVLPGTVVMAKAVVNPYATVEANVIVNTSAVIDHDCKVHEASHIRPGAILAGNVTVGSKSWVGLGAKLLEGVTIGDGVIVGAGSVVTSNFPDRVLLTGVPVRVKRQI